MAVGFLFYDILNKLHKDKELKCERQNFISIIRNYRVEALCPQDAVLFKKKTKVLNTENIGELDCIKM